MELILQDEKNSQWGDKMNDCHLELWERYILDHARCESCEGAKIEIPLDVAKEMRIYANATIYVDTGDYGDTVEVDQPEYRKRIFEQGHVSNLIVLYAILGKKYDKVRIDLTCRLIEYITSSITLFSDWKNSDWIEKLCSGKTITLDALLPMVVKWIRYPYTNDEYKKFQYLIPLYLLLGDYKHVPESRKELRLCLYDIVAGTNFVGDPTWQDVFYDISRSGKVFKEMVEHADDLFSTVSVNNNRFFFDKLLRRKRSIPEHVLRRVGNWLSFCAYITLVSKYRRYALNAEGFRDAKGFVSIEASRLFLEFREKLG